MVSPAHELAVCSVCGATGAETITDHEAVRREIDELRSFHGSLAREAAAGSAGPEAPPAPPVRHAVVRCRECGLLFRRPAAPVGLPPGIPAAPVAARATAAQARVRRLTRVVGRPGRVLEVGSAAGSFLAAAQAAGWFADGLEEDDAGRSRARACGLRVRRGTLERYHGPTGFDAVVCWSRFDQLADPRSAAFRARDLLAPRGVLALRIPNGAFYIVWRRRLERARSALERRIARAALAHNHLLAFPYRHGFTPSAVRRLLSRAGFRVERLVGDACPPDEHAPGWPALEERATLGGLRLLGRLNPASAPWLEVYARAG